jgi:hypothetical protein
LSKRTLKRALLLGGLLSLASAGVAQASSPPSRFIGSGTTYWEYAPGNTDGTGRLIVKFDSTLLTLGPGQADFNYTFDTGTQPFFWEHGDTTLTGNWIDGWSFSSTSGPPSSIQVGPFGDGTAIPFQLQGAITLEGGVLANEPWYAKGSFAATQAF